MKKSLRKWCGLLLCLTVATNIIPMTVAAEDEGIAIDDTNFPDEIFREYVSGKDTNQDGRLSEDEINAVTSICVGECAITDLKGIEYFVDLKLLDCSGNSLTSLDVASNENLNILDCTNNQLKSLDFSNNTVLEDVMCYKNRLTSLELDGAAALKYLDCNHNQLTKLDVSNNTKLVILECYNNNLTTLDVSHNVGLTTLSCYYNRLTKLDVRNNTELRRLYCGNNNLTLLDVSYCEGLENFGCQNNELTCLDVGNNTGLHTLSCNGNNLTTLNLSNNKDVSGLNCSNNNLASLDISGHEKMRELYCTQNNLTVLDVSKNTKLARLYCCGNQLTSLDLYNNNVGVFSGDLKENGEELSYNCYVITLDAERKFDLNRLPGSFDVSRTHSWTGGVVTGNILTVDGSAEEVTYKYKCSDKQEMTVKLIVNVSEVEPLAFRNNFSIETNYVDCPIVSCVASDYVEGGVLPYTFCKMYGPDWLSVSSDGTITGTPQNDGKNSNLVVRVTDAAGEYREVVISVADTQIPEEEKITIDAINFPDKSFREYVTQKDTDKDGALSETEIKAVTVIDVADSMITDLKGIEYFTALEMLWCGGNALTELDLSANTSLKRLSCDRNALSMLDVSNNVLLSDLVCYDNQLTALNINNNVALKNLICDGNKLSALNLDNNTSLVGLSCYDNHLTTLDVSHNTALEILFCGGNQLTSLDLSNNSNIYSFYGDKNQYDEDTTYDNFNTYVIVPDDDYTFDFTTLPGDFDVSRTGNWIGGVVDGNILTVGYGTKEVSYVYDCGSDLKMTIKLSVIPPSTEPLIFYNNAEFDIKTNYVDCPIDSYSVAGSVEGGTTPYTFSKTSGPDWVSVSPEGMISGTPKTEGTNPNLIIRVTDANNKYKEISVHVGDTKNPSSISIIEAVTDQIVDPVYEGNRQNPVFTVTQGSPAIFDHTSWQKKTDEGEWNSFSGDTFTEGTWRIYSRIYIDSATCHLSDSPSIKVNGINWTVDGRVICVGNVSYAWVYSPEFTVTSKLPYEDVSESDWFYDGVYYNYAAKTMTGKDDTHFAPLENLARAQFAVIIHRMNGKPEVEYKKIFPDVADNVWYTEAILWASDAEVVTGYTDTGLFGPADNITREQMAVMMYRYAKYHGYDTGNMAEFSEFEDASSVSSFAVDAMKWAVGNGIITGKYNGTRIDPQGKALRGECALIIQRFIQNIY